MVFSSIEFLLYFFPIFFIAYLLAPASLRNLVLLGGSLYFYAQGEPQYLLPLAGSVLVNYLISQILAPTTKKKGKNKQQKKRKLNSRDCLFGLSVAANLGVLIYFKVAGTGIPIGISFYTFQVVAYLTDVYRKEAPPEQELVEFMTFLVMFPKMVSGPIADYGTVREELRERKFSASKIQDGLRLFAIGLAAKVLLADRLGSLWHDLEVTGYESVSARYAWIGAAAFSMKLYFDFGGYSLMAIGLGKVCGFELPENFNVPYMARSVREFYRRWHMTLGKWFTKYLYIPLGGNRKGEVRTVINLLIVWLVTGFWHGASLNFLYWGMFLGACIVLERILGNSALGKKIPWSKIPILPHLYLWIVIPISWMLFAIPDLDRLEVYLTRMFGIGDGININPLDWMISLKKYGVLLGISAVACTGVVERVYRKWKDTFLLNLLLAALFWYCVSQVLIQGNNPFMYLSF